MQKNIEMLVKKVCKVILESALETFYSLSKLNFSLQNHSKREENKHDLLDVVEARLKGMLEFAAQLKTHLRQGVENLVKEVGFGGVGEPAEINLTKKSQIHTMLGHLSLFLTGTKNIKNPENSSDILLRESDCEVRDINSEILCLVSTYSDEKTEFFLF